MNLQAHFWRNVGQRGWLFLFVGGVVVRFVLLGVVPPGLNQDEASIGYDAWAILHYGVDRNGFPYPVHLVSWGSGQNALYAYLSMPFIALFGLTPFAVRFPNALLGCFSLFFFGRLAHKIGGVKVGNIALFLLTINPWHVMMSRWGLESNIFPALVLLGVYCFVCALETPLCFPLALGFLALSLYAYGTAYFFIPLFLLITLFYLWWYRKLKVWTFLWGMGVLIILALPIILFVYINLYGLESRYIGFFSIPKLPGAARFFAVSSLFSGRLGIDLGKNLSHTLRILCFNQGDGLPWNGIPPYGSLFPVSIPFLLGGIGVFIYRKRYFRIFDPSFFLWAWFWVAFALGWVTNVNINRMNILFLPAIYLVAVGVTWVSERVPRIFRWLVVAYLFFFAMFLYTYFVSYPQLIGPLFFESFGEAIQYATAQAPPHTPIYVTDRVNMPYIFVLFYQKIDPRLFTQSVIYVHPGEPFQRVKSFGRYIFSRPEPDGSGSVYVLHNSEKGHFPEEEFLLRELKNYSVAIPKVNSKTPSANVFR